jgi:hypothetical protein
VDLGIGISDPLLGISIANCILDQGSIRYPSIPLPKPEKIMAPKKGEKKTADKAEKVRCKRSAWIGNPQVYGFWFKAMVSFGSYTWHTCELHSCVYIYIHT